MTIEFSGNLGQPLSNDQLEALGAKILQSPEMQEKIPQKLVDTLLKRTVPRSKDLKNVAAQYLKSQNLAYASKHLNIEHTPRELKALKRSGLVSDHMLISKNNEMRQSVKTLDQALTLLRDVLAQGESHPLIKSCLDLGMDKEAKKLLKTTSADLIKEGATLDKPFILQIQVTVAQAELAKESIAWETEATPELALKAKDFFHELIKTRNSPLKELPEYREFVEGFEKLKFAEQIYERYQLSTEDFQKAKQQAITQELNWNVNVFINAGLPIPKRPKTFMPGVLEAIANSMINECKNRSVNEDFLSNERVRFGDTVANSLNPIVADSHRHFDEIPLVRSYRARRNQLTQLDVAYRKLGQNFAQMLTDSLGTDPINDPDLFLRALDHAIEDLKQGLRK